MFQTKLEVDKHVDNSLKKINNETERNLRCFSFAKLYFSVGAYEQAVRYVNSYLSVKPKSPEGYSLLGRALEKLGKKEAALEAYKKSLQQDPKQNNLVIKVCELMAEDDVDLDQSGARYFCELAQSLDPHNSAVYILKERLISSKGEDPKEVIDFLLKELENRPTDVNLRIRLMKHFIQHDMIKEAYKHASDIEEKKLSIFQTNLTWYEVFAEVLLRYERDASIGTPLSWEFWFLSVSVLDKLAAFSLDEHINTLKSTTDYITSVFNFDQMLSKASQNISDCPDKMLQQVFLTHYEAQLHFHMAVLAFKQAKQGLINFKDCANMTLPVWFVAYHCQPPDLQGVWFNSAPESKRKTVCQWHKEASFRCSQSGHVLRGCAKDRRSLVLEKAEQYSSGLWRDQFFKRVFVKRDQQQKISTSFFGSSSLEPTLRLPEISDLSKYDSVAQTMFPDSLHHYIWLLLNTDMSNFQLKSYDGLQYTVRNLTNCAAETLNVLDVQSFLYCAALCAKSLAEQHKLSVVYHQDWPEVMPASITPFHGTPEQAKFVTAAYKMYRNEPASNFGEIRLILIRGIEVVRCVGNHALDVKLLIQLAEIFAERAKTLTKQSEIEANDARAELYWKHALPLLEKYRDGQGVSMSVNRTFDYRSKPLSVGEISKYIEKGKLFAGSQLMKKKEYERAMDLFEGLKDPYASFYQSQIYRQMADQKMGRNKENVTSEMRSQNSILLSRARDCLYLTLDRLRDPSSDRNHPLNAQLGSELEKVERLLSRIDSDSGNRNECDGMSDENASSDNSAGEHYLSTYTHTSFHNGTAYGGKNESHIHSTPLRVGASRQEARPSPERLDAQIRQLVAKDAAINNVLEQNKTLVELYRSLLDEFKGFKDVVKTLSNSIEDQAKSFRSCFDDLKQVKRSVDELKHSVDDLQNISDVVQEMKKELNDLKKDQQKNAQLSEEDLYVLDPDYNAALDYNINASAGPSLNPLINQMYQHYPSRMPPNPAGAYPNPALYPGLYSGLAYAYGGLGLPQPGLPFVTPEQQLQQLTALTLGQQQLPPPGASLGLPLPNPVPKESPKTIFSSAGPSTSIMSVNNRAPPVNVVITSSDPLPTTVTATSQPILSVTIPPQHIKGAAPKSKPAVQSQPHSYQIPMPVGVSTSSAPSVLNEPPPAITTQSLLTNVAPPVISAIPQNKSPNKNVSLGLQIEKTLDQTFSPSKDASSLNVSASSVEAEYDPRPDFKPIVPLPDEVPVTTGEEKETELFCRRAKLFRLVDKEWKERGVGNLKILFNPETGKVRLIMRREQVHKICANHMITKDMSVTPMTNNDRAYAWAAHDYADQEVVLEKFCVRFKTVEEAKEFSDAFELAKGKIRDAEPKKVEEPVRSQPSLGGFVFKTTPTVAEIKEPAQKEPATTRASPFANFTFGNKQQSTEPATFSPLVIAPKSPQEAEEFVPTAEFKPVVDLPDLVEVKTGEENSEVLFEERAKLFRYDDAGEVQEWKERGVGIIKVLKDETVRLVMRRDQVHKICCNHQVLKKMAFKQNQQNPKAVVWHAQDFSEGVLKPETFTVKFKTEESADKFLKTIQSAQTNLDENDRVTGKHHKPEALPKITTPKAVKGSWECKNCYIVNDGKTTHCVACDTPKSGASPKKDEAGPTFSFGVQQPPSAGWGDAFKPAAGSWECKGCLVRNPPEKDKCASCEASKDGQAANKGGINLDTGGQKFSFGVPAKTNQIFSLTTPTTKTDTQPATTGFGDAFKAKPGTWECKHCYIRNEPSSSYCLSCESPKDDTVPKKEPNKGINLDTPGVKFTFGITPATNAASGFAFGDTGTNKSNFSWKPPTETPVTHKEDSQTEFVFGSPQKHEFEFKPRSPRRISTGQGDESDGGSYVDEEEDNIYFKPVIPLPDKIVVKTGEEDEDVLYCERAKLFRFVDGEWKERGVGDVKILREKSTGKLRVLMRREQVLKVCLNHRLTKEIDYRSKDEKTWLFYAQDYSEGEVSNDQFCIRFKSAENAQAFKRSASDALNGDVAAKEDSDSDVEFVSESQVTPEEEQEALKLGLPPKFFAYRQLPDCKCDQCKKEDEYLKELFMDVRKSNTSSLFFTPESGHKSTTSLFTTPTSTPTTLKELLQKPSVTTAFTFGTDSTSSQGSFTFTPGKSIFGTSSLFGSTSSVFGSASNTPSTPKVSIFSTAAPNVSSTKSTPSSQKESIVETPKHDTSGSIFGNDKKESTIESSKPIIFGSLSNTPTGQKETTLAAAEAPKVNIFGNLSNAGASTTPTTSTFGNPSDAGATSVFSASSTTEAPKVNIFKNVSSTGSIFGSPGGSIFGGGSPNTSSTSSIFSNLSSGIFNKTPFNNASSTSIFGGGQNVFGTNSTTSIFGSTPTFSNESLFGSATSKGSIFDSARENGTSIGAAALFGVKTESPKDTSDEIVLKCDSDLSFASLAAQNNPDAAPAFAASGDEKKPFAFLGAGMPVFGSQAKKSEPKNKADNEEADESAEGEHDPHFEPIVPLPDQIVVTTGEENETAMFNERAKLFRFDEEAKEWKERGVGQIKILFHPVNNTYRLLLRREQVHKVVLNQRITAELELQPMSTSDKAWIWVGYNYTDDTQSLEKLAIKFKNVELAEQFRKAVKDSVAQVQSNKSLPITVQDFGVEDVSREDENGDEEDPDDDEDEDEDDDDDEKSVMFSKRCTLSELTDKGWETVAMGVLEVYFDPELYAARISFADDQEVVCSNTLIGMNTVLENDKNECSWKGVEWADGNLRWRNLKATFSSVSAAQEFHSSYLEGLNYAEENGLLDELPNEPNEGAN